MTSICWVNDIHLALWGLAARQATRGWQIWHRRALSQWSSGRTQASLSILCPRLDQRLMQRRDYLLLALQLRQLAGAILIGVDDLMIFFLHIYNYWINRGINQNFRLN